MLAVTGYRTTIIQELAKLLPDEEIVRLDLDLSDPACAFYRLPTAPRYVLAAGILHGRPINELLASDIIECLSVNLINVIRLCEMILEEQADARICIIGSESARRGSFDRLYAASKAGVHAYVQQRTTKPMQQLVCLSPPIISDSGMTRRRKDYPQVLDERSTCRAFDVAHAIKRVIYDRPPNDVTNCILPIPTTQNRYAIQETESASPRTYQPQDIAIPPPR